MMGYLRQALIIAGIVIAFIIVRYFYFLSPLVYGTPAPSFSATGPKGQMIQLDSLRGQYVLLDFWGSWCGPCRANNKIFAMMYRQYRDAAFKEAGGIRFISVALEKNRQNALAAISADRLEWPDQIIEEEMLESPLAKLYGIRKIPTSFLIGADGRIILSDPDIKELDDYLAHNRLKN